VPAGDHRCPRGRRKELLAVEDGYRESTDSWAELLRDLKARGMSEPKLVTGDGALGLWGALRDVFPHAREQRCWVHKTAKVLDALPKRVQPQAERMLHEIVEAATRNDASRALDAFVAEFEPKWPKAAEKLTKDREQLLAFYDFPAEHWRHLRTTNPIESSFATVKLRTRVTKGAGSKGRRTGDGLQAARRSAGTLADVQRRRTRQGAARRSDVQGRNQDHRRPNNHGRESRRLMILHRLIHNI
jgi:putative transposase